MRFCYRLGTIRIVRKRLDLKALSALENLAPAELRPKANQIAALLSEFVAEIEAAAHSRLTNWISASKVDIPEIKPAHAVAVFGSYFSGGAPFEQAKSRDDLPDAFIYESTKDLVTEVGELFVVSRDGNLATHLRKIDGVTVYADIHALLGSGNLPVKPDDQSFALRRKLKEYREEIKALAKDSLFEDLESRAFELGDPAQNPSFTSIQIDRVVSLQQFEIENEDPVVVGARDFLYRFKASATVIGSRQATDNDEHIRTFDVLGTNLVRAIYETSLSGSLVISVDVTAPADPLTIKGASVDSSVVIKFAKQGSGGLVERRFTEVILEVNDSKTLRHALRDLTGFVFVVGRSRKCRIEAGLSLLAEVANEHPDNLFVGPGEALLNNPVQNVASLDKVIQRTYDGFLSPSETDRIIALEPQGVMIWPQEMINTLRRSR